MYNQVRGVQKFGAQNSTVQNTRIGAQKFSAQKDLVRQSKIVVPKISARKSTLQRQNKNQTDQQKKDAKKEADPLENLAIKKRLHKAKRTLEDIQKLNIKQWTSLKNSVEKETKTWKKCYVKRNQELQHHGPSFQCDQY